MSLGICMKAVNAYTFKSKTDFFFEFIPQIILLSVLFGYMNLLIILKWLTNYTGQESNAPSIINTMINIPLKGGFINGSPFIGDLAFNQKLSVVLLLIGLVCVPIMLFPKPFIL
jgi:V-type H+-transporting ATPase subunit a